MSREAIEEAIEVLEDAGAEMLMETGEENYYGEAIAVLRQALETDLARVGEVGVWGEWQGLTDEDYKELSKIAFVEVIEKIERVLKEKNT